MVYDTSLASLTSPQVLSNPRKEKKKKKKDKKAAASASASKRGTKRSASDDESSSSEDEEDEDEDEEEEEEEEDDSQGDETFGSSKGGKQRGGKAAPAKGSKKGSGGGSAALSISKSVNSSTSSANNSSKIGGGIKRGFGTPGGRAGGRAGGGRARNGGVEIYAALKRGNAALEALAKDWAASFGKAPHVAVIDMTNFVVCLTGAKGDAIAQDPTLYITDADGEEWEELLEQIQSTLEDGLSDKGRAVEDKWPVIDRKNPKLRKNVSQWWAAVVKACRSGSAYNYALLEALVAILQTLSSANVRALRHTATVCTYVSSFDQKKKKKRKEKRSLQHAYNGHLCRLPPF